MLYEICRNLRNYFDKKKYFGTFEIVGGVIKSPSIPIKDGQYIRVIGSVFNDGIYKYGEDMLRDEKFEGAIWLCAFPSDFLQLVSEIEDYNKKFADSATPYTSESFGGYSYTKGDNATSWRTVYGSRLNAWRKI